MGHFGRKIMSSRLLEYIITKNIIYSNENVRRIKRYESAVRKKKIMYTRRVRLVCTFIHNYSHVSNDIILKGFRVKSQAYIFY